MPELPPDPDALEAWEKLPKNKPSRQAMPPMTGGARWAWGFLLIAVVLGLLAQYVLT